MLGIENLQKMGTTFLLCNNAFGGWCAELEARGKGKVAEMMKDLQGEHAARRHHGPGDGHSPSTRRRRPGSATTDSKELRIKN